MDMLAWQISLVVILIISLLMVYRLRLRDFLLPSRLLRRSEPLEGEADVTELEKISIIIPCHNQGEQLLANLPGFLSQDYPRFEIIVCDEISTDDTLAMLSPLEKQYPQLRHRAIPATSRGISLRQLSITLGIRAAHSEWIVITGPDCRPVSDRWLLGLARDFSDSTSVVIGYGSYGSETGTAPLRMVYDYIHYQMMNLRAAISGRLITLDLSCVALRRSKFLESGGYAGSLGRRSGEGEQLAAALMRLPDAKSADFAAICHSAEGLIFREMPDVTGRRISRLCHRDGLCGGSRRLRFYRWREGVASVMYLLFVVAAIGYMACTVSLISQSQESTFLQRFVGYYQSNGNISWWQIGMDCLVILLSVVFFLLPHIAVRRCFSALCITMPRLHPNYYMLTQPLVHLRESILKYFR